MGLSVKIGSTQGRCGAEAALEREADISPPSAVRLHPDIISRSARSTRVITSTGSVDESGTCAESTL
eukprot:2841845-Pyramimonas_sp.AAC.1